jgi:hypothetical protein
MDPFTAIFGSLIGGASSIAGGIMGANEQDKTAKQNYQINLLNYYQRERERQDRIREAQEQQKERKEGATNASGDRVHYVAGKGWVTDLSAKSQEFQGLQDKENEHVLLQDLPAKRTQMFQNLADAAKARYSAEGVESALKRSPESLRDATSRTLLAAGSNNNSSWDDLTNELNRGNLRSGNSQYANIAREMGRGRATSMADAAGKLSMAAEDNAQKDRITQRSGLYNILGALQARGAGMPQVNYTPQNIQGTANAMLSGNQSLDANAGNQVTSAFGQKGGTLDYSEPNYGWANAVSGGGQALGSMFGNIGSYYNSKDRYGKNSDGGTP